MLFPIQNPFKPSALKLVDRGIAAEEAGDTRAALRDYAQAVTMDPSSAPARFNRGRMRLVFGETREAEVDRLLFTPDALQPVELAGAG